MWNGRMAYEAPHSKHGRFLYFRQGKWAIGDTLGGPLAWFWTSDAKYDFNYLDSDKSFGYDAPCPTGQEFRSTISDRQAFVLDTCVDDANSSIDAWNEEYGGSAPEKPANKPVPTNGPKPTANLMGEGVMIGGVFVNKPDPTPETPDAPTFAPDVEEERPSCNKAVLEKISGKGTWECIGEQNNGRNKGKKDDYWFTGSKCTAKCSGSKIGVCGPKTKYPILDNDKAPGYVKCLKTGQWDYHPKCKCVPNNCKIPKLFPKSALKAGASYSCRHYNDPSVAKDWFQLQNIRRT